MNSLYGAERLRQERLLMIPPEKTKNILREIVAWIRDDPQPLRTATPSSFGFSAIWSARSTRTIYIARTIHYDLGTPAYAWWGGVRLSTDMVLIPQ